MSYNKFHAELKDIKDNMITEDNLEKGISIVIPVYDGIKYIDDCLQSILHQEIKDAKFEVVIVFNGIFNKELNYILYESDYINRMDIILLINDELGAGSARNLGMKSAKYSHVTFIDVDDYVSPNYIQSSFDLIDKNTVVFTQIHDVHNGLIDDENSLNKEIIRNYKKEIVSIKDLNKIATITVCKIIPRNLILRQSFRTYLRSGEDTVFFTEFFINTRPNLKIIPIEEEAVYYRRIVEDSVSRKSSSFDFLISQRLEILEIFDMFLSSVENLNMKQFIRTKYNAQIVFMNKYISENFDERSKIIEIVKEMSFNHFNYSLLNRGFADTLVISYCFPPYSDTSATIVAKRIIEQNQVVDVISNNMSRIRGKEESLKKIIDPMLGTHINVNVPASFSNMYYLNKFIDRSFVQFTDNIERYKKIYSRAMFPISHIPALFMKIIKPEVYWTAEFSDPLLFDIESEPRYSNIDNESLIEYLKNKNLLGEFSKFVDDNLFNLTEIIPFALADKLVFTNENQLEYMIIRFEEDVKNYIRNKSVVEKHPTLEHKYYHLNELEVPIEKAIINIAYFGNFYSLRGYENYLKFVDILNENSSYIYKLHVYTNINSLAEEDIVYLNENGVQLHSYLPFTEFLNVTTKYDMLLISDAETKKTKPFNPYLPSKLSDYIGSGTPIVAFTEDKSILSKLEYKNLYKLSLTMFNDDQLIKNYISNQGFQYLISSILKNKKERLIEVDKNGLQLIDQDYQMCLSKDLKIKSSGAKEWIIFPSQNKIRPSKSYEMVIKNHKSTPHKIDISSFYSVKKVIRVKFIYNDDENNKQIIDISKLRKISTQFEIPGYGSLKIKLIYKKSYNSDGFVNAGRLKINNL